MTRSGSMYNDYDFSGLEKIADAGMEKDASISLGAAALYGLNLLFAAMSARDAYKAYRRGENARAAGNLGLAAVNLLPGGILANGVKALGWAGKAVPAASRLGKGIGAAKNMYNSAKATASGLGAVKSIQGAWNAAPSIVKSTGRFIGTAVPETVAYNMADSAVNSAGRNRDYMYDLYSSGRYAPSYEYNGDIGSETNPNMFQR